MKIHVECSQKVKQHKKKNKKKSIIITGVN